VVLLLLYSTQALPALALLGSKSAASVSISVRAHDRRLPTGDKIPAFFCVVIFLGFKNYYSVFSVAVRRYVTVNSANIVTNIMYRHKISINFTFAAVKKYISPSYNAEMPPGSPRILSARRNKKAGANPRSKVRPRRLYI
jgi:hypothetical protein